MDVSTILALLAAAFGGGMGWGHLTLEVRGLKRELARIRDNHLRHIEEAIEGLPCRRADRCQHEDRE